MKLTEFKKTVLGEMAEVTKGEVIKTSTSFVVAGTKYESSEDFVKKMAYKKYKFFVNFKDSDIAKFQEITDLNKVVEAIESLSGGSDKYIDISIQPPTLIKPQGSIYIFAFTGNK